MVETRCRHAHTDEWLHAAYSDTALHSIPAIPATSLPLAACKQLDVRTSYSAWYACSVVRKFELGLYSAKRGTRHSGIAKAQQYLARFGYLRNDHEPSVLDEITSQAIATYQRVLRLPVTGELDVNTVKSIEAYRCGVSDRELIAAKADDTFEETEEIESYVLRGCSYAKLSITHLFLNGTPDIAGDTERDAIRSAFETWRSSLCGMSFSELTSGSTDLESGWFAGDHGDGSSFDGPGNIIAHAFYPPPCGGIYAGGLHFDEDELWNLTGSGGLDLETVALHEIGHLLGLAHSSDPSAVMYPTYMGVRRTLGQDDIDGIRRLYPMVCRRADSGDQAGTITEISSTLSADGQHLVTAVRLGIDAFKIIVWDVSDKNAIQRVGASEVFGDGSLIKIVRTGAHYVTAHRRSDGTLQLTSWTINASGVVTRRADSGSLAGGVNVISLLSPSVDFIVTAVQALSGQLLLIGWRVNANGTFTRLLSASAPEAALQIETVSVALDRIVTAIRMGDGLLRLIHWRVSASEVTRLGDSGSQAGFIVRVRAAVDSFGHVVTPVQISSAGALKVITWRANAGGSVERLGDVTDPDTAELHEVAFALGHITGAVRVTSGNLAGNLKLILWSAVSSGLVRRVGESAFLAGATDLASTSPESISGSTVTSVRTAPGNLKLIGWGLTP